MTDTNTNFQTRITLVMVLINAFTTPLMLSAVNVALPHIANSLNLDAVVISWVPMAYLMASAMFLLLFGRLADVYGRKKIFLLGTILVVITSSYAATANNSFEILSARFLQGISAAMLYATQVAIVSSIYPPKERGKIVGLTVSMIYLGLCFGTFLGGILIDKFGWRSAFLLHIPLAILVIVIGSVFVKDEWRAEKKTRIDVVGALTYAIAIACLCYGVTKIPNYLGYILILISVIFIFIFIKLQYSLESPLINVKLFFTNKVFTFSCIASLIMYTATFANVVLISLYLQYLQEFSATQAGIIMMIQPLVMAVFSPLTGKLSDRYEPRYIATIGMILTILGLFFLSGLNSETSLVYILLALVITGLGFSFFSSPNVNAIMSSVEKKLYGSATSIMASMRILGQLSSMILVAMIFSLFIGENKITEETYHQLQTAIQICFMLAALLCIPGLYLSFVRGNMHEAT